MIELILFNLSYKKQNVKSNLYKLSRLIFAVNHSSVNEQEVNNILGNIKKILI